MKEKTRLTLETNESLIQKLEERWQYPMTGVPSQEVSVVLAEMIRRAINEQKRTNQIQFWLNVAFGASSIVSMLLSLYQILCIKK